MAAEIDQLSNTDKNLWRAIVSEALANLKYNAYAIKAMEEGLPEVAQVFQEVSGAETIHGINHLRVSGEIGTSLENLRAVSAEESKEFSSFYPRMIKEAIEEGQTDAANSFTVAMEREIHHLDMFSRTLERLEAKQTAELRPATPAAPVITLPPATEEVKDTSIQPAEAPPKLAEIANLETYVTAAMEVDRERGRVANLGRLREVVFGAQDGILSTVALVTSVAVAVGDTSVVLVAGLAAAFAGMVSMATGAFLGSRAELDVQRSEIAREARELEDHPAEELAELVFMFQREGHTYAEAQDMANEISMDKDLWLRTLLEKELGISMDETTNPTKDALVMGASFIVAAIIPIVPYLFLEGSAAISVSVTAALLGLLALGAGKGRLVQKSPLWQGLEILGIGALSAGIGYALGDVIPRLINR
jgi:VIT1/CCC1 family predicted Fe2+/Mn2+ transporter/rubrerythrin